MAFLIGLMEDAIKVIGSMENKMEEGFILINKGILEKELGKMELELVLILDEL